MQDKYTKCCARGKIFMVRSGATSPEKLLKLGWAQQAFVWAEITVWFAGKLVCSVRQQNISLVTLLPNLESPQFFLKLGNHHG